jgi:type I restriction enzyme, R subunit
VHRVAQHLTYLTTGNYHMKGYNKGLPGLLETIEDMPLWYFCVSERADVLREHFAENSTLQRIREGKVVRDEDLESLAKLVLEVDDKANVKHLAGHEPEARRSLLTVFRSLVGLDPAAVEKAFTDFVHKHPRLLSQQLRFLQVLQNYIAQNGGIEIERLYEPPFTTVHAESVDGVFTSPGEVDEILAILSAFEPKKATQTDPPPASRAS